MYEYILGDLEEGPEGLEMTLELRGPKDSEDQADNQDDLLVRSSQSVKGTLHLHRSNAIERWVSIPEFAMKVTDLRLLKQQGKEMSQQYEMDDPEDSWIMQSLQEYSWTVDDDSWAAEQPSLQSSADAEDGFMKLRRRKVKVAHGDRDLRRAKAPELMERVLQKKQRRTLQKKHSAIRQRQRYLKWF